MRPRLFHLFILILVLAACAKAPPKTAQDARSLQEAESLIAQWRQTTAIYALSAYAEVQITYRGRREFVDAAILAQAPNRLRLELVNDLGETVGRLTADGTAVTWWDAREDAYTRYPPNEAALKKVFGFPISVEDFLSRIFLKIPEGEVVEAATIPENPAALVQIDRPWDRLTFQEGAPRLHSFQKRKSESGRKFLFEVSYAGYAPVGGKAYPMEMRWSFHQPKFQMSLKLRELDLNPRLDPQKFALP